VAAEFALATMTLLVVAPPLALASAMLSLVAVFALATMTLLVVAPLLALASAMLLLVMVFALGPEHLGWSRQYWWAWTGSFGSKKA